MLALWGKASQRCLGTGALHLSVNQGQGLFPEPPPPPSKDGQVGRTQKWPCGRSLLGGVPAGGPRDPPTEELNLVRHPRPPHSKPPLLPGWGVEPEPEPQTGSG